MAIFVVPHMVKDILAKASKKSISSFCILLLVIFLTTNRVGGVLRFWESLHGGSKHSNIYGL